MDETRVRQPRHYESFHCLGADCEDTCCNGWRVMIDRHTYDLYQNCSNPELQPSLTSLITINTSSTNDDDYASITPNGTECPFLSDGLCSVQQKLGEDYLSKLCATYPRVMNVVDGVIERSLETSCPEAARIALLDSHPMEFDESQEGTGSARLGSVSVLVTSGSQYPDKPYRHFHEVRRLVLSLLQNRHYPLSSRLIILGHLCDKLHEMAAARDQDGVPDIMRGYAEAIDHGLFNDLLSRCVAQTTRQLEIVLELIVCRITSDFTPRRFLECYEEFMHGIEWRPESAMAEIGIRYAEAHQQYYAPFMRQHEYVMERLLVNYVYKTLFPFGPQESTQKLSIYRRDSSIPAQYILMAVHYAILKAILIGMSAYHKSDLSTGHLIKLIQSYAKAFEHSTAFPALADGILAGKGMKNAASMAMLIQN
jgi:lysine-N-methylase